LHLQQTVTLSAHRTSVKGFLNAPSPPRMTGASATRSHNQLVYTLFLSRLNVTGVIPIKEAIREWLNCCS
jgi:hypothetical protein